MKKIAQKFTALIMAFMMGVGMLAPAIQAAPVYAEKEDAHKAQAAILTGCAEEGEKGHGEGIKCIILLVADILSILIGIVGVIGIIWVGIQYLTAGGNEEKTRKAKRRLFEIIIGIVAYVLIYLLLKWLLPGFDPTTNSTSLLITTLGA